MELCLVKAYPYRCKLLNTWKTLALLNKTLFNLTKVEYWATKLFVLRAKNGLIPTHVFNF